MTLDVVAPATASPPLSSHALAGSPDAPITALSGEADASRSTCVCTGHSDVLRPLEPSIRKLREELFPTPNNHPAIFAATVAARPGEWAPWICCFRDAARCRAAILGRLSTRRNPCRVGYLTMSSPRLRCLDIVYGGLLHDGSAGARSAICRELRRVLSCGEVDHIMINHLPLRDHLFEILTDRSRLPSAMVSGGIQKHYRFELAGGSFDQTLQRFSRKHRYNLRRAARMLGEQFDGDLQLLTLSTRETIDDFLQAAETVANAGYQRRVRTSPLSSPVNRAVLDAASRAGSLRCYLLRGRDEMIAYQMGVVLDGVYWLLSTAFLPRFERWSPGQVLLLRALEDLAKHDIRTVDYGFGDAPYKQMYSSACQREATIHLYADTPRGIAARVLQEAGEGATRRVRSVLERAGVVQIVKKRWRRRLTPAQEERPGSC